MTGKASLYAIISAAVFGVVAGFGVPLMAEKSLDFKNRLAALGLAVPDSAQTSDPFATLGSEPPVHIGWLQLISWFFLAVVVGAITFTIATLVLREDHVDTSVATPPMQPQQVQQPQMQQPMGYPPQMGGYPPQMPGYPPQMPGMGGPPGGGSPYPPNPAAG